MSLGRGCSSRTSSSLLKLHAPGHLHGHGLGPSVTVEAVKVPAENIVNVIIDIAQFADHRRRRRQAVEKADACAAHPSELLAANYMFRVVVVPAPEIFAGEACEEGQVSETGQGHLGHVPEIIGGQPGKAPIDHPAVLERPGRGGHSLRETESSVADRVSRPLGCQMPKPVQVTDAPVEKNHRAGGAVAGFPPVNLFPIMMRGSDCIEAEEDGLGPEGTDAGQYPENSVSSRNQGMDAVDQGTHADRIPYAVRRWNVEEIPVHVQDVSVKPRDDEFLAAVLQMLDGMGQVRPLQNPVADGVLVGPGVVPRGLCPSLRSDSSGSSRVRPPRRGRRPGAIADDRRRAGVPGGRGRRRMPAPWPGATWKAAPGAR